MEARIIRAELKENEHGDTKLIEVLNTKYVLEGEGIYVINNKIKKGDLVFIPKGTKYKNLKGATLLAIASQRFDRNNGVFRIT